MTLQAARLLRPSDASMYLGMNKNQFNTLVRPKVTLFRLGKRAIAFDRLELDAWAEEYRRCNGRSALKQEEERCQSEYLVSSRDPKPVAALNGTLINGSKIMDDFVTALERTMRKKPRHT
jgi:predicted DNA-binding transcriptional regulator AlpA